MGLDKHLFIPDLHKYIFNTERMFKEIYFKILIPEKDTTNPLSHQALASLYFFN